MRLSCRGITTADLPVVVDLLCEGFPERTRSYWQGGIERLAAQAPAEGVLMKGVPHLGSLLVVDGTPVGVLLLIHTAPHAARSNLSSWYVRPEFCAYASLLVSRAVKSTETVFVNVSPALHTVPIIVAQGFNQIAAGCFVGVPALAPTRRGVSVTVVRNGWVPPVGIDAAEARLLLDHTRFGCLALWLETPDGGHAFVFRRRVLRLGRVPCAMLIHCPSLELLERFAGPLGRALAREGLALLLAGADRPLRGVPGRHFPAKLPIYAKGTVNSRSADLSYTEAAVFGM